jgi:hypothetical protein
MSATSFQESRFAWSGPFARANLRISPSTRNTPLDVVVEPFTPPAGLASAIKTELLTIVTENIIPALSQVPDGQMTLLFVNGWAFADVSGAFSVSGNAITWLSTIFSVNPGAEVVACYTYVSTGPSGGGMQEDILTIASANVFPPLSQIPNGKSFTLYVEGRPFFLGVANPAFTLSGSQITWTSTVYSVQPGAEVVAQYSV